MVVRPWFVFILTTLHIANADYIQAQKTSTPAFQHADISDTDFLKSKAVEKEQEKPCASTTHTQEVIKVMIAILNKNIEQQQRSTFVLQTLEKMLLNNIQDTDATEVRNLLELLETQGPVIDPNKINLKTTSDKSKKIIARSLLTKMPSRVQKSYCAEAMLKIIDTAKDIYAKILDGSIKCKDSAETVDPFLPDAIKNQIATESNYLLNLAKLPLHPNKYLFEETIPANEVTAPSYLDPDDDTISPIDFLENLTNLAVTKSNMETATLPGYYIPSVDNYIPHRPHNRPKDYLPYNPETDTFLKPFSPPKTPYNRLPSDSEITEKNYSPYYTKPNYSPYNIKQNVSPGNKIPPNINDIIKDPIQNYYRPENGIPKLVPNDEQPNVHDNIKQYDYPQYLTPRDDIKTPYNEKKNDIKSLPYSPYDKYNTNEHSSTKPNVLINPMYPNSFQFPSQEREIPSRLDVLPEDLDSYLSLHDSPPANYHPSKLYNQKEIDNGKNKEVNQYMPNYRPNNENTDYENLAKPQIIPDQDNELNIHPNTTEDSKHKKTKKKKPPKEFYFNVNFNKDSPKMKPSIIEEKEPIPKELIDSNIKPHDPYSPNYDKVTTKPLNPQDIFENKYPSPQLLPTHDSYDGTPFDISLDSWETPREHSKDKRIKPKGYKPMNNVNSDFEPYENDVPDHVIVDPHDIVIQHPHQPNDYDYNNINEHFKYPHKISETDDKFIPILHKQDSFEETPFDTTVHLLPKENLQNGLKKPINYNLPNEGMDDVSSTISESESFIPVNIDPQYQFPSSNYEDTSDLLNTPHNIWNKPMEQNSQEFEKPNYEENSYRPIQRPFINSAHGFPNTDTENKPSIVDGTTRPSSYPQYQNQPTDYENPYGVEDFPYNIPETEIPNRNTLTKEDLKRPKILPYYLNPGPFETDNISHLISKPKNKIVATDSAISDGYSEFPVDENNNELIETSLSPDDNPEIFATNNTDIESPSQRFPQNGYIIDKIPEIRIPKEDAFTINPLIDPLSPHYNPSNDYLQNYPSYKQNNVPPYALTQFDPDKQFAHINIPQEPVEYSNNLGFHKPNHVHHKHIPELQDSPSDDFATDKVTQDPSNPYAGSSTIDYTFSHSINHLNPIDNHDIYQGIPLNKYPYSDIELTPRPDYEPFAITVSPSSNEHFTRKYPSLYRQPSSHHVTIPLSQLKKTKLDPESYSSEENVDGTSFKPAYEFSINEQGDFDHSTTKYTDVDSVKTSTYSYSHLPGSIVVDHITPKNKGNLFETELNIDKNTQYEGGIPYPSNQFYQPNSENIKQWPSYQQKPNWNFFNTLQTPTTMPINLQSSPPKKPILQTIYNGQELTHSADPEYFVDHKPEPNFYHPNKLVGNYDLQYTKNIYNPSYINSIPIEIPEENDTEFENTEDALIDLTRHSIENGDEFEGYTTAKQITSLSFTDILNNDKVASYVSSSLPIKDNLIVDPKILRQIEDFVTELEEKLPQKDVALPLLKKVAEIKKIMSEKEISTEKYFEILQTFYDVMELLKKHNYKGELQDLLSITNHANLDVADNGNVLEFTFLVRRPTPIVIYPFYYVKYHLPMSTFVPHMQSLLKDVPRTQRNRTRLHEVLLRLSDVAEASPSLQNVNKDDLLKLTLNNGNLVKTKVINGTDRDLKTLLDSVRKFNAAEKADEIINSKDFEMIQRFGPDDKLDVKSSHNESTTTNKEEKAKHESLRVRIQGVTNSYVPTNKPTEYGKVRILSPQKDNAIVKSMARVDGDYFLKNTRNSKDFKTEYQINAFRYPSQINSPYKELLLATQKAEKLKMNKQTQQYITHTHVANNVNNQISNKAQAYSNYKIKQLAKPVPHKQGTVYRSKPMDFIFTPILG